MKKLITLLTLLTAHFSFAGQQASYELSCRAKAKEIAAETYRTCVTENKAADIERLKKNYQEKLRNLKEEYETEIGKMGLKKTKKMASPSKKINQESDDSQMDLPEPIPVDVENNSSL